MCCVSCFYHFCGVFFVSERIILGSLYLIVYNYLNLSLHVCTFLFSFYPGCMHALYFFLNAKTRRSFVVVVVVVVVVMLWSALEIRVYLFIYFYHNICTCCCYCCLLTTVVAENYCCCWYFSTCILCRGYVVADFSHFYTHLYTYWREIATYFLWC